MKTTKWNINSKDSKAGFKVRKLMITNVTGQLKSFYGQIETDTNNRNLIKRICFKGAIGSIKTDDAKRDEHLKSADFFNLDKYPYLLFVAENFSLDNKLFQANLTVKNITKTVPLEINYAKSVLGENDKEKIELSLSGKIDRRAFGLTWEGTNDAGDLIVGENIKLNATFQFDKQDENVEIGQLQECIL